MVMIIVAVHVVFLGGLLFSGCRREQSQSTLPGNTNSIPTLPPMGEVAVPSPPGATNIVTVVEPPTVPVITNEVTTTPPLPTPPDVVTPDTDDPGNVDDAVPLVPEPNNGLEVPVATGQSEYVVEKGDNYTVISRKHGVSIAALKEANPAVDPNRIAIGQVLVVPSPAPNPAEPTVPDGSTQYEVKAGDNLFNIAKTHNTTVKGIRDASGLTSNTIRPGQKLIIPKPTAAE